MENYYGVVNRRIISNHQSVTLFSAKPGDPSVNFYATRNSEAITLTLNKISEDPLGFSAIVDFVGNKNITQLINVYSVNQSGRVDRFDLTYLKETNQEDQSPPEIIEEEEEENPLTFSLDISEESNVDNNLDLLKNEIELIEPSVVEEIEKIEEVIVNEVKKEIAIKFSKDLKVLQLNDSFDIFFENCENYKIEVLSSNNQVLKINKHNCKVVGIGQAELFITVLDGNKTLKRFSDKINVKKVYVSNFSVEPPMIILNNIGQKGSLKTILDPLNATEVKMNISYPEDLITINPKTLEYTIIGVGEGEIIFHLDNNKGTLEVKVPIVLN